MKPRSEKPFFATAEEKLIREHMLKEAPEQEIHRFILTCERTGLDPFTRQIYGHVQNKKVSYREKGEWKESYEKVLVIIIGIDGFRAIAERAGGYQGQTSPEWYYVSDEGKAGWHDVFVPKRDKQGNPIQLPEACRVGIHRKDFVGPCFGVANFDSFAKWTKGKGDDKSYYLDTFWKRMPEHMIAKVAEAQAFRKAFPLLAADLYLEEEIKGEDEPVGSAKTGGVVEEMLPGAKYVDGHDPSKPSAPVTTAAAPTPEKPAEKPAAPAAPEATVKKTRAKKEAAAPETPAEPAPEPSKEPEEALFSDKSPAEQAADVTWKDYQLATLTTSDYRSKKLGELTPELIGKLQHGWVEKHADKIKNNPEKLKDATMVTAAFKALGLK